MANVVFTRKSQNSESLGSRNVWLHYLFPLIVLLVVWNYFERPFSSTLSGAATVVEAEWESVVPGFRRIDTHAHFVPPFYADILKSLGLTPGSMSPPKWNVSEHLDLMAKLEIETAVLSNPFPGAGLPGYSVEQARHLARELNEYGHMLAVEYPGRFLFFAALVLPDVEGSVAEAVYALDTLKAAGVMLMTNAEGYYLGCEDFDPLMEVLNSRETTVFIHPNCVPDDPSGSEKGGKGVPPFVVDFLLDTTRAAANLVMNNVTARYPNVRWILAHSGGFVPFVAYRMGNTLSSVTNEPTENLMRELRTFYADTALSSSPTSLPSTVAFLTHDHITFGSDFPYAPIPVIEKETAELDKFLVDHTQRNRHRVNYHNADRLFNKTLSYWRNVWRTPAASATF